MANPNQGFKTKADAAAEALEHSDSAGFSKIFNAEDILDRAYLADLTRQKVDRDRGSHPELPQVELTVRTDMLGRDLLVDVKTKQPGTNGTAAESSVYHNEFSEGTYNSPYSFSHPQMTTYDTIDPVLKKPVTEDLSLADGRTSHNTFQYDANGSTVDWAWSDGITEHHVFDKQQHEISADAYWEASGKKHHRHEQNEYDPVTGTRMSHDLSFDDKDNTHTTFDKFGHRLTSVGADYEYDAKYDDKTGKKIFEHEKTKDDELTSTFDPDTEKLLTKVSKYSFDTISEVHKYDPITKNEIYSYRESRREKSTATMDPSGKLLTSDLVLTNGKTSHQENTYDGSGNQLTSDLKELDGTTQHDEWQYDKVTGKKTVYSSTINYPNGTKLYEEDLFDKVTGKLTSEDFSNADGTKQHFDYARTQPDKSGDFVLKIKETDTAANGSSNTYDYDYFYSADKHRRLLKLHWNAIGADGEFVSREDESRVDDMHYRHIPKAMQ